MGLASLVSLPGFALTRPLRSNPVFLATLFDPLTWITYQSFVSLVSERILERDPMEEIRRAFKLFDDDGTGKISLRNLRRVAKEIGDRLEDDELYVRSNYPSLSTLNASNIERRWLTSSILIKTVKSMSKNFLQLWWTMHNLFFLFPMDSCSSFPRFIYLYASSLLHLISPCHLNLHHKCEWVPTSNPIR